MADVLDDLWEMLKQTVGGAGQIVRPIAKVAPFGSIAISGFDALKNLLSTGGDKTTAMLKGLDALKGINDQLVNLESNKQRGKILQSLLDVYGVDDNVRAQQLAEIVSSASSVGKRGTADNTQTLQMNLAKSLQENKEKRAGLGLNILELLTQMQQQNVQQSPLLRPQSSMAITPDQKK
ncbi:MAG: hypothetical protein ACRCX2_04890 [Paraclostridium sp.]